MIPRTSFKLDDAKAVLQQLRRASGAYEFRAFFASFLSNARAVTYALQAELKHVQGFDDWYKPKQEILRNDSLLRYVHDARIEDFHRGGATLEFSSQLIAPLDTLSLEAPLGADAKIGLTAMGLVWIVNEGSFDERRIPIEAPEIVHTTVSVLNAPTEHKGQHVDTTNPVVLAKLAIEALEELVLEANYLFGEKWLTWNRTRDKTTDKIESRPWQELVYGKCEICNRSILGASATPGVILRFETSCPCGSKISSSYGLVTPFSHQLIDVAPPDADVNITMSKSEDNPETVTGSVMTKRKSEILRLLAKMISEGEFSDIGFSAPPGNIVYVLPESTDPEQRLKILRALLGQL